MPQRPGVDAAKRLSVCEDARLWKLVEGKHPDIAVRLADYTKIERNYRKLGKNLSRDSSKKSISKDELFTAVYWKFKVGKPRLALMNYLRSNSEESVQKHSTLAIDKARTDSEDDDYDAIDELTKIQGVGPATASAVLSLVRPDRFAYMYDEVIECFLPKRTYTLSTYIIVNNNCMNIASKLGKGWTTSRVATALWIAAKSNAIKLIEDGRLKGRTF
mmetsp:Transcript_9862/g.24003  ORF Transcript_9862/g.24003 Transcript_9862/m.24003 type:complete len:217 (+) Transcript_9862:149-799(+)|eukprot:CAMPEP_0197190014 /NCGR_PEP_ID=MMETSP1423-20130617/20831_1 /TAXON_ID=476441 /ORGANISM="Pseudo-nitzschia heimii, Strain UNC1101" /LENGTH=216 /DNA_ID=CAMNT_0042642291 /DNA_START=61 /DNA_END=711 /DNA_ORIENTATION=-